MPLDVDHPTNTLNSKLLTFLGNEFGQLLTSFCHNNKKWNCVSLTCGAMEVQVERSSLEEEELEADDAQRQEYYNGIIDGRPR